MKPGNKVYEALKQAREKVLAPVILNPPSTQLSKQIIKGFLQSQLCLYQAVIDKIQAKETIELENLLSTLGQGKDTLEDLVHLLSDRSRLKSSDLPIERRRKEQIELEKKIADILFSKTKPEILGEKTRPSDDIFSQLVGQNLRIQNHAHIGFENHTNLRSFPLKSEDELRLKLDNELIQLNKIKSSNQKASKEKNKSSKLPLRIQSEKQTTSKASNNTGSICNESQTQTCDSVLNQLSNEKAKNKEESSSLREKNTSNQIMTFETLRILFVLDKLKRRRVKETFFKLSSSYKITVKRLEAELAKERQKNHQLMEVLSIPHSKKMSIDLITQSSIFQRVSSPGSPKLALAKTLMDSQEFSSVKQMFLRTKKPREIPEPSTVLMKSSKSRGPSSLRKVGSLDCFKGPSLQTHSTLLGKGSQTPAHPASKDNLMKRSIQSLRSLRAIKERHSQHRPRTSRVPLFLN